MNTPTSKTSKAVENPEVETDVLAAEIASLRKDFQALIEQVATVGLVARNEATSTVRGAAAKGIEAGEHVAGDLLEEWREIDRKVVDRTRESPWRALGVAGLVGLVLGLFLRR